MTKFKNMLKRTATKQLL